MSLTVSMTAVESALKNYFREVSDRAYGRVRTFARVLSRLSVFVAVAVK